MGNHYSTFLTSTPKGIDWWFGKDGHGREAQCPNSFPLANPGPELFHRSAKPGASLSLDPSIRSIGHRIGASIGDVASPNSSMSVMHLSSKKAVNK